MKGQVSDTGDNRSSATVLPHTLRLAQDEGIDIISSDELGRRLRYPGADPQDLASTVRKKGVGYYVNELKRNVGEILGLNNHWNIAAPHAFKMQEEDKSIVMLPMVCRV